MQGLRALLHRLRHLLQKALLGFQLSLLLLHPPPYFHALGLLRVSFTLRRRYLLPHSVGTRRASFTHQRQRDADGCQGLLALLAVLALPMGRRLEVRHSLLV